MPRSFRVEGYEGLELTVRTDGRSYITNLEVRHSNSQGKIVWSETYESCCAEVVVSSSFHCIDLQVGTRFNCAESLLTPLATILLSSCRWKVFSQMNFIKVISQVCLAANG